MIDANDLDARRSATTESIQREDLSAIETIETIVEIVDVELINDEEYASTGEGPWIA